ncbi:oligopeptide ABC transporter substrate-binding protein [Spiroplasma clarkii]|nr:oligopeptide ABC transporter substrate-binding protein [Spiroplasma clarkii]
MFNTTFSYAVTNWNTAYTMQSEDQLILANTNATLLAIDQYGRIYGDIFKSNTDLASPTVATVGDNGLSYSYTIRDDAKWWNKKGDELGAITADHMWNTAYYTLYTSKTASSVGGLWINFIKGAGDMSRWLNETADNPTLEQFKNYAKANGFGLEAEGKNVKFTLTKEAPFFESLLCYSAFSPIRTTNDVPRFDSPEASYSGAFLPKEVTGTRMILEKNENYHFSDLVTIEKINYLALGKGDVQQTRTLFEAGNTSGFVVASTDSTGWNRYIGDDALNPLFNQAYNVPSARQTSTFVYFFNTYNGKLDTGDQTAKKHYAEVSKLLQNDQVRSFISTNLDRSEFVRYYSGKFDGTDSTSSMLRNVYTSPTVGIVNGKDYTDFLQEKATSKISTADLKDGTDFLKTNADALNDGKSQAELITDIKAYMDAEDIPEGITLDFLVNGDFASTSNPFINQMLAKFNAIPNNPIKIQSDVAPGGTEYSARAQNGQFDLYSGGWGPDFADPSTFLATLALGGDMANYTGTKRFVEKVGDDYKLSPNATALGLGTKSGETSEYIKRLEDYTKTFNEIDTTETSDITKRFTDFADLEYKMLYDDFLIMPMYTAATPKNWTVSHMEPYSSVYITTYGVSNYKLFTAKINEKLLTKEQLDELYDKYDKNLIAIQADKTGALKDPENKDAINPRFWK